MSDPTAQKALSRADAAHDRIEAHEDLCAERYGNIHGRLDQVVKILGWGGTTIAMVMIGVIGFLLVRMIDSPSIETERLKAQIEILQQGHGR